MNLFMVALSGFFLLALLMICCCIIVRVILVILQVILACYSCLYPDSEHSIDTIHFDLCCCDIFINCSCHGFFDIFPKYECIKELCKQLSDKMYYHCCNPWGCMAKYFDCRFCRKNIIKIVPVKKNINNDVIIIINPNDNTYKLGVVSKEINNV